MWILAGVCCGRGTRSPGSQFALERWEVTDEPVEEGRFEIIGVLTEKNED